MLLLFAPLLLVQAWSSGGEDPATPFKEYLDSEHLVCLKWGFSDMDGTITFTLIVNTTGWVGFGLSPDGGMEGADIVLGGSGPSGAYFSDRHATGNTMLSLDDKQSYTLLSVSEAEGQTSMTFQRPIDTCDHQDFLITADPIKLIYLYGLTDEISYHDARRGTKEVNLLRHRPRAAMPSATSFSVTMDKINIPPIRTHYHCRVMRLPKLDEKHHVYRIEPVVEHPDFVQHIVLYRCSQAVNGPYDGRCAMVEMKQPCVRVVATWRVGGGAFELPENAGIAVGGERANNFYKLQIHYDNPHLETGARDSSGLKMYYTDQLRPHDIGILDVGVILFYGSLRYTIPPKAERFRAYAVCNTTLFSELHADPVPDLQAFAMVPHTHLAGRKVRAGLFRDGKQIEIMVADENFNADMKQIVHFGNVKTIKPRDEIVVECTYNTVDHTEFTQMWLSTTDEMCFAFIYYYPEIDINTCMSIPELDSIPTNQINMLSNSHITEEISKYETLLKSAPQIEIVANMDYDISDYVSGTVRNFTEISPATCERTPAHLNPASSQDNICVRPGVSWTAVAVLLTLWIAIMQSVK